MSISFTLPPSFHPVKSTHILQDIEARGKHTNLPIAQDVVRILSFTKPTRDLRTRLLVNAKGMNDAEMKDLSLFVDLLDRCLNLNPEKRCTPAEALRHPFIMRGGSGKV